MPEDSVSFAVGNRRLLKLASFLRTLPRKRFDYRWWVGDDWQGGKDLSCGTTACALGWATVIPEFRKKGLKLEFDEWDAGKVRFGHREGLRAAEAFFGIHFNEAASLFLPNGDANATAKQVARKIERFVDRRRKSKRAEAK